MSEILKELHKQDSKWQGFALKICTNKELSEDLVQEMYIKFHECGYTSFKSGLIYTMIYHLFIDYTRKKKDIPVDVLEYEQITESVFEPTDYEQSILNRFNQLQWRQQELIKESYTKSLREIQKDFPMINYAYAYRQINEGMKSIFGEDFKKQYNNTRNKRR